MEFNQILSRYIICACHTFYNDIIGQSLELDMVNIFLNSPLALNAQTEVINPS